MRKPMINRQNKNQYIHHCRTQHGSVFIFTKEEKRRRKEHFVPPVLSK